MDARTILFFIFVQGLVVIWMMLVDPVRRTGSYETMAFWKIEKRFGALQKQGIRTSYNNATKQSEWLSKELKMHGRTVRKMFRRLQSNEIRTLFARKRSLPLIKMQSVCNHEGPLCPAHDCGWACNLLFASKCLLSALNPNQTTFHNLSKNTPRSLNARNTVSIFPVKINCSKAKKGNELMTFHKEMLFEIEQAVRRGHSKPSAWWRGQAVTYLLKQNFRRHDRLQNEDELSSPVAGLLLENEEKLLNNSTSLLTKSMRVLSKWFEKYCSKVDGSNKTLQVFIAPCNHADLLKKVTEKYIWFKFFCAKVKLSGTRGSNEDEDTLDMINVRMLARSDFVVCSFMTNTCRLVHYLMQSKHADARERVVSLGNAYNVTQPDRRKKER